MPTFVKRRWQYVVLTNKLARLLQCDKYFLTSCFRQFVCKPIHWVSLSFTYTQTFSGIFFWDYPGEPNAYNSRFVKCQNQNVPKHDFEHLLPSQPHPVVDSEPRERRKEDWPWSCCSWALLCSISEACFSWSASFFCTAIINTTWFNTLVSDQSLVLFHILHIN